MESDFAGVQSRKAAVNNTALFFAKRCDEDLGNRDLDDSDVDESEREQFRKAEILHLFNIIDKDNNGFIDQAEVEELLHLLNHKSDVSFFNEEFQKLVNEAGKLDFKSFYAWYMEL
jgi:hypothetical protein